MFQLRQAAQFRGLQHGMLSSPAGTHSPQSVQRYRRPRRVGRDEVEFLSAAAENRALPAAMGFTIPSTAPPLLALLPTAGSSPEAASGSPSSSPPSSRFSSVGRPAQRSIVLKYPAMSMRPRRRRMWSTSCYRLRMPSKPSHLRPGSSIRRRRTALCATAPVPWAWVDHRLRPHWWHAPKRKIDEVVQASAALHCRTGVWGRQLAHSQGVCATGVFKVGILHSCRSCTHL